MEAKLLRVLVHPYLAKKKFEPALLANTTAFELPSIKELGKLTLIASA